MLLDLVETVSLSRGAKNITLRFSESRFQAYAYGEIRALAKSDHSLQRSRKRLNFPKFVFDLHTSPPIQPRTGLRMHISDEHRAASSEHLSDFGKKRSGVFDVTQNKIAQNQVRGARFECGLRAVCTLKSGCSSELSPRKLQHLNGSVNAQKAPRPHALKHLQPSSSPAAQIHHIESGHWRQQRLQKPLLERQHWIELAIVTVRPRAISFDCGETRCRGVLAHDFARNFYKLSCFG